jgi:predicted nucleic acid-binding Zn ribbon protein
MHKKRAACVVCGDKFTTTHPKYLTCSKKCRDVNKVNRRYQRMNNDWAAYFKHLLSKKKDSPLTVDQLIYKVAGQDYKCVLSGIELTCIRVRGKVMQTNASIDRIHAGKEYNYDNIQIVCRAVNSFRGNMEVEEFIFWCKEVANHGVCK